MAHADESFRTEQHDDGSGSWEAVRRFRLVAIEGAQVATRVDSSGDRCAVGSDAANDLAIDEPTVSRFHCEIRVEANGARVVDLSSRNGTFVDGVRVQEAYLRNGSTIKLGRVSLRFDYELASNQLPLSQHDRLGDMVGGSVAMRAVFAVLERAATSDVTVLLNGETGTGKTAAAYEIHRRGSRADAPFVTIDCGAVPANLLDSELFGHEKGAFTGADSRRVGAFEEAANGTVFLDEISELPLALQTKLLRVLEARELRRLGSNERIAMNARVIAATNRDLREEVNVGRFRSDLYFRVAVVHIRVPALRERVEDIPALVDQLLAALHASDDEAAPLRSAASLAAMKSSAWPGNVRELRNHVQRCLFYGRPLAPSETPRQAVDKDQTASDSSLQFAEAKRRAVASFERAYIEGKLREFSGNVAEAARAAGMHRVSLHRLVREHNLQHLTPRGGKD